MDKELAEKCLLKDEDVLFYTKKSEFAKGGVGFTLRTFLNNRSLHYPEAIREYVEYIKEAQLIKVISIIRKAVAEEITREIDGCFSLAPTNDSYFRILIKDLRKALQVGHWPNGQPLGTPSGKVIEELKRARHRLKNK